MNHPLTDEMCRELQWQPSVTIHDVMRNAYDLAIKHVRAKVNVELAELRKYPSIGERMHIASIFEDCFDRAMRCKLPQEDN